MKIRKIVLKDFHQFKDIEIDLTYPKGHEKEGQPLQKVCFIGQSGTGKTTLLELLPKYLFSYNTNLLLKIGGSALIDKGNVEVVFGESNEYSVNVRFDRKKEPDKVSYDWMWTSPKIKNRLSKWETVVHFFDNEWTKEIATKLIYFPANLNYDINIETDTNLDNKKIIDFSKDNVSIAWNIVLDSIQKYQEQELQLRQEISKIVEQSSNDLPTIRKALKRLEDWKQKEFNPVQDVADKCLDRLLHYFKLRVKTELDIKTKDEIGFIKLEDFAKNEIPHGLWSTGTKQVVLSALPLYLLKPKHTIILFDEPERSLYPDLQRIVVDFYSSLTEDCQFFYSTHSPIIASSFEPWEIVELKFNKEGGIYRELYYDGENDVKNYKLNPRLMRWDDILQRVFDLENDGSSERKVKLDELATYNVKYRKLEKAGKLDTAEGKKLIEQIERLSKELSKWN